MEEYLLKMRSINKSFAGTVALKDVDFNVRRNEIHALMGENGAGKSTLIKILTGIYTKDSGEIIFDGREVELSSSLMAQKTGISTIYQELNLEPYLSICENIFIGREIKNKLGLIDWKETARKAKEVLRGLGIDADVSKQLHTQSTAVQQMVAIARAITINAKLLIMDEATSSLEESEVKLLFEVIRKLRDEGMSIVFITHKMNEIYQIADSVTILRDGENVTSLPIGEVDKLHLVSYMIGRDAKDIYEHSKEYRDVERNEVLCALKHIKLGNRLSDVNVDVRRGEVLGLAGLLGSGRTETCKIVFGDYLPEAGTMEVEGKVTTFKKPAEAIKRSFAYCSEDRKTEGIFPQMSVNDNLTMVSLRDASKNGVLSVKDQKAITNEYVKKLNIKTSGMEQSIVNLSGGNQQKVLIARWLCMHPELIILDEPTRGIDIGAKFEIQNIIQDLAEQGMGIIMVSSEMEELVRNCDRVIVFSEGKTVVELVGHEITEDRLLHSIAAH